MMAPSDADARSRASRCADALAAARAATSEDDAARKTQQMVRDLIARVQEYLERYDEQALLNVDQVVLLSHGQDANYHIGEFVALCPPLATRCCSASRCPSRCGPASC